MVSDYRLHSTQNFILHSATLSEPLRYDRYIGQDFGRMQHQHLQSDQHGLSSYPHPHPHPYPHPHPHPLHPPQHPLYSTQSHDFHQAVLREIEKERIRQDIIRAEIIRRHGLEAEVRRELMIDRERALQGGGNGFLEKRIMAPLTQRDILNYAHVGGGSESLPFQRASSDVRTSTNAEVKPVLEGSNEKKKIILHVGGGSESLPFQRASSDVRMSTNAEVKPVLEGSNKKKKIILQAKPIDNITGAKRARSGTDASESPSDGNLKKKAKEEWSCALCQVSAGSERILNEHLEGNKHKKKEAALISQKAGENSRRHSKNKVAKSKLGGEQAQEVKLAFESLSFNKSGDARSGTDDPLPLQGDLNSDNLKRGESIVHQRVQENDKPKMTTNKFWCEICQIVVGSWKNKESHEQGKKHKRQLKRSNMI